MIQSFKDMLAEWNANHDERAKLQHAYLSFGLVGILVAGLVGLLNRDVSDTILRVCFIGLGIFLVNAIAWALLYSLVVNKLPKRTNGRK